MEEILSLGPNSVPWTFPSSNFQMQIMQVALFLSFTYHFPKEESREPLGSLESLHSLHRGENEAQKDSQVPLAICRIGNRDLSSQPAFNCGVFILQ